MDQSGLSRVKQFFMAVTKAAGPSKIRLKIFGTGGNYETVVDFANVLMGIYNI